MNLISRVAASGRDRYEDKTCVCDFVIKTQRWYQSTAVLRTSLLSDVWELDKAQPLPFG